MWLTTGDEANKLRQLSPITGANGPVGGFTITIDRSSPQQTIDGFGAAISNSAAYLLYTQVAPVNTFFQNQTNKKQLHFITFYQLFKGIRSRNSAT